ncbi:twin-arginine translocase TatA/TatE family subunit [Demequina pelophila]|uniref:twin-arginine translocase TatA/TatE family subunit n=1 Tax=Demequina pelophila TaxID=1638984 RepID=UPI000780AD5E|nr:twin-arginine translocase TatA/TatE family subunit [Demequina pelophila]
MLDINGGEFVVLVLVAIVVVGPERLPEYARQLRTLVVRGRDLLTESKQTIRAEMGDEVDWRELDPRQYDPRRIVREALAEPSASDVAARRAGASGGVAGATGAGAAGTTGVRAAEATPGRAPFDSEAT